MIDETFVMVEPCTEDRISEQILEQRCCGEEDFTLISTQQDPFANFVPTFTDNRGNITLSMQTLKDSFNSFLSPEEDQGISVGLGGNSWPFTICLFHVLEIPHSCWKSHFDTVVCVTSVVAKLRLAWNNLRFVHLHKGEVTLFDEFYASFMSNLRYYMIKSRWRIVFTKVLAVNRFKSLCPKAICVSATNFVGGAGVGRKTWEIPFPKCEESKTLHIAQRRTAINAIKPTMGKEEARLMEARKREARLVTTCLRKKEKDTSEIDIDDDFFDQLVQEGQKALESAREAARLMKQCDDEFRQTNAELLRLQDEEADELERGTDNIPRTIFRELGSWPVLETARRTAELGSEESESESEESESESESEESESESEEESESESEEESESESEEESESESEEESESESEESESESEEESEGESEEESESESEEESESESEESESESEKSESEGEESESESEKSESESEESESESDYTTQCEDTELFNKFIRLRLKAKKPLCVKCPICKAYNPYSEKNCLKCQFKLYTQCIVCDQFIKESKRGSHKRDQFCGDTCLSYFSKECL